MANLKTNFSISALVNPDTSRVQKILRQNNFVINADIRTDAAEQSIQRLNRVLQNTGQWNLNGFERINTQIQTGLSGVDDFGNRLTNLTRYIETFKNAIGDMEQRVTVMTESGIRLNRTQTTIANGVSEITTDTRQFNEVLNGLNTTVTQVSKTTLDTAGNTRQVIETTREWTDANGRLNTSITTLDENNQQLAPTIRTISDNMNDATNQIALFGSGVERAIGNFLRLTAITIVRNTIREVVDSIQDFNSALIEFRKVSDLSGESLDYYVSRLAELGEITGSTVQAMVEASTEFRKSGFSDEDSARLASIAEMYRNVADEEISAGEAASFIIAQMKAFNKDASEAEHIIDAVNEVANNYAVSSADIAKNLGNMSEVMAINNVTMEQQIGMLTGVTEITRKASSASRGLVMISSRLTQVLDDSSSTGKKLANIYKDLGIELKNEDGQLRSHYEIFGDLAKQWDNLSENQQKYIALTSAGARQQQNFVALMDNWNQVVKATASAYNSASSAARENEKVMDSIEKKYEILHSQLQQLAIGFQDTEKGLLDIGIALLKFANTDLGKVVTGILAVTTATTALGLIIESLRYKLQMGETLSLLQRGFLALATSENVATAATAGLNAALTFIEAHPILLAITLITSAYIAFKKAVENANEAVERAYTTLIETKQEITGTQNEIEGLSVQLEDINNQLSDLKDKKLNITDADELSILESETEELKEQKDILETKLKLAKLELEVAKERAETEAKKTLSTGYTSKVESTKVDVGTYDTSKSPILNGILNALKPTTVGLNVSPNIVDLPTDLELLNGKLDDLNKKKRELIKQSDEIADKFGAESEEYKKSKQAIDENQQAIDDYIDTGQELAKKISEANDAIADTESNKKQKESLNELVKSFYETAKANGTLNEAMELSIEDAKKIAEEYGIDQEKIAELKEQNIGYVEAVLMLRDGIDEENESIKNNVWTIEEAREAYKGLQNSTNDLISNLKLLSEAVDEQEKQGQISLETQKKLIDKGMELVLTYNKETGACELDTDACVEMAEAKLKAELAAQKVAQANLTNMLLQEASAATVNAQAFLFRAKAMGQEATASYIKRQADRGYDSSIAGDAMGYASAAATEATEMLDATNKSIEMLEKQLESFSKNGAKAFSNVGSSAKSAGKSASGAGKAAKDAAQDAKKAIQEQTKALEEQKKKYDTIIKWIEKQYDKEIDKIKKAKDEALDAEEAKIKAKEKEKDKALDAIEAEINALKKEKDARKKYWDDQIDTLKKANQERKDSLELQEKLDALEKARNTKVRIYKEGQGFVYDVDQTAVNKAKEELDKYLSKKAYEDELARLEALRDAEANNYEQRINSLEEYKDNVQKNYEEQIENLKNHKEEIEKQYDKEIELWENYKQKFQDMVNEYEEEQARLLVDQEIGIDKENNNWLTRLDNLRVFVDKYKALLAQIDASKAQEAALSESSTTTSSTVTSIGTNTVASGSGGGVKNTTATPTTYKTHADILPTVTKQSVQATKTLGNNNANWRTYQNMPSYARGYASGTDSIKDDQIAIVGENPNQELVIGSKINNGQLMSLDKGTGIVNADSSKTLAGLLNQVGKFGASGFGSGNGTLNNNYNNDNLVINGVTIQGSNIKDPETFVNGLLGLKSKALQRAYTHK